MFSDFGNINDMTKSQFNTAIEYYRNRIKMLNEDTSISNRSKAWFLERYEARLKSLEDTLETLNMAISVERRKNVFIDENTTTLNALGKSSSATDNFNNLTQNTHKHRVSQRWKIVGAILLPVVGTIPFLVSWKRAKKRHQEINTRIAQENIELGNFVGHEKRPYENTLLTSTKFTEAEMANLLKDPVELAQIEALALTGAISPVEKTNLTKKLAEVREFGQKNGYNMSAILTDPAFKTKADKTDSQITAHEATYNGTPASATNLKAAYDAIKILENLKGQVQTLYNDTNNKKLETLLANIDTKIDSLKASAKTAIIAGVDDIVKNINDVKITVSPPTDTDYTTAISAVDTAAKAANTYFGPGITAAQALSMADELGFNDQTPEHKKFTEIEAAKNTKTTGFETKLNELNSAKELATNISTNFTNLENALTSVKSLTIDATNIDDAIRLMETAKSSFNFLTQNYDDVDKSRYSSVRDKYNDALKKVFLRTENFPLYEATITDTTKPDNSSDIDTLERELSILNEILTSIESEEYKSQLQSFDPLLSRHLNTLISTAKTKISAYEVLIASKEIDNYKTAAALGKTLPTDKDALLEEKINLEAILQSLNSDFNNLNKTLSKGLAALKKDIQKRIATIEDALKTIQDDEKASKSKVTAEEDKLTAIENKITSYREEFRRSKNQEYIIVLMETFKPELEYLKTNGQTDEIKTRAKTLLSTIDVFLNKAEKMRGSGA